MERKEKERVGDGWVVRDEEEGRRGERRKLKGRGEDGGGKGLGEVRSGAWRMHGGGLLDLEWIQGFLLHLLVSMMWNPCAHMVGTWMRYAD